MKFRIQIQEFPAIYIAMTIKHITYTFTCQTRICLNSFLEDHSCYRRTHSNDVHLSVFISPSSQLTQPDKHNNHIEQLHLYTTHQRHIEYESVNDLILITLFISLSSQLTQPDIHNMDVHMLDLQPVYRLSHSYYRCSQLTPTEQPWSGMTSPPP